MKGQSVVGDIFIAFFFLAILLIVIFFFFQYLPPELNNVKEQKSCAEAETLSTYLLETINTNTLLKNGEYVNYSKFHNLSYQDIISETETSSAFNMIYDIYSFNLNHSDDLSSINPDQTDDDIYFLRDNNSLIIRAGSNTSDFKFNADLFFPNSAISNIDASSDISYESQGTFSNNFIENISSYNGELTTTGSAHNEGYTASDVASEDCSSGTCDSTNSWESGFDNTDPADTQIDWYFNVSALGITGTDVTNLTMYGAGCWHGGFARNCDGSDEPEFGTTGNLDLYIYNWTGSSWIQVGSTYTIPTTGGDEHQSYSFNKEGGLAGTVNSSGIIKMRYNITGETISSSYDVIGVYDTFLMNLSYSLESSSEIARVSLSGNISSGSYEEINISLSGTPSFAYIKEVDSTSNCPSYIGSNKTLVSGVIGAKPNAYGLKKQCIVNKKEIMRNNNEYFSGDFKITTW